MRVYTVVGELEGPAYVGDVVDMDAAMTASGLGTEETLSIVHADGEHSEWYWAREFPAAYSWLWASTAGLSDGAETVDFPFALSFSPDSEEVVLHAEGSWDLTEVESVEMLDVDGRMVMRTEAWTDRLPMSGYGPGLRIVRVRMKDGQMWSRGLVHP